MTESNYFTPVPIAQLTDKHVTETLYRNPAGDYWLSGSGDEASHWNGRQGTQPLTFTWAMSWIHQHEIDTGFVRLFDYGEEEQKQKRMISANLRATTYNKLQALAVMRGCTKTDILEDLIRHEWSLTYPKSVYEPTLTADIQRALEVTKTKK